MPVLMRVSAVCLAMMTGGIVAAPQVQAQTANRRGVVIVSGETGQSEAINARGRDVQVSGNGHRVQVRGTARTLRVTGTNNHVRIYAARTIQVSGSGNQIMYYRGSPRINNNGGGNMVNRRR